MYGLDVVRMIVTEGSSHSFRISMVGDDVVKVCELFVANCAYARLLADLAVKQLAHLGRGSQLPISTRVVGILNSLNSESDQLWFG